MRVVQSSNKHLWYMVDKEDKICFVGITKEQVMKHMATREI